MNLVSMEILNNIDPSYKEFSAKLIPNIDSELILGLRAPVARKIAKNFVNTESGKEFLSALPHKYHDENIVHAYMLGLLRCSSEQMREHLIALLPYVDNWAVCDTLCASIKGFFKNLDLVYPFLLECINSGKAYYIRFGLVCLLDYYVNDEYIDRLLAIVKSVRNDEYYVNMALAWLISVMLVKQYERTLPVLYEEQLDTWVHNKSIGKACESYRITDEQQKLLKNLRRKNENKH